MGDGNTLFFAFVWCHSRILMYTFLFDSYCGLKALDTDSCAGKSVVGERRTSRAVQKTAVRLLEDSAHPLVVETHTHAIISYITCVYVFWCCRGVREQ